MTFGGIFAYASPSYKLLGYEPDDLVGRSGFDMIHPEDKIKLLPLAEKYARKKIKGLLTRREEGLYEHVEFRFPDKWSNWRDMEATANLVRSISGKGYDILVISRDVTERRKAEHELRAQKELLDKANKELKWKVEELEAAMRHIKRLEGLVPICVNCKKMRVEKGDSKDPRAWMPLEEYISQKTNASITHGLCPDCVKKMYGEAQKNRDS